MRRDKVEKRMRALEELALGPPQERPLGDAITLFAFLAVVLFFFVWLFSGTFLWSLVSVGAIFAVVALLTWRFHVRRGRRRGLGL